jgi:uncharacterized protein YjbJ (UPF0337 family)
MVLAVEDGREDSSMGSLKRKSAEQEVKGVGQRARGTAQEIVGRVTGNESLRSKGELNQVAGQIRNRAGEAGRKVADAIDRERSRRRRG